MNAHSSSIKSSTKFIFIFFCSLSHIINSLGQWPISASSAHLLAIDRHLVNFASVISLFRIVPNTISALKIVYACEFFFHSLVGLYCSVLRNRLEHLLNTCGRSNNRKASKKSHQVNQTINY